MSLLPLTFLQFFYFMLKYTRTTNVSLTGGKIMAYLINDDCISCGACVPECPVSAISEGDDKMVIDDSICVDCGACANVCPVDAPNPQ